MTDMAGADLNDRWQNASGSVRVDGDEEPVGMSARRHIQALTQDDIGENGTF
jgi:hypothetical protein